MHGHYGMALLQEAMTNASRSLVTKFKDPKHAIRSAFNYLTPLGWRPIAVRNNFEFDADAMSGALVIEIDFDVTPPRNILGRYASAAAYVFDNLFHLNDVFFIYTCVWDYDRNTGILTLRIFLVPNDDIQGPDMDRLENANFFGSGLYDHPNFPIPTKPWVAFTLEQGMTWEE